jgi:two-component system, NarL family, response regulator DesR
VLNHAAGGSGNAEVAAAMHLSHGTVRPQLPVDGDPETGARNRAEAVRLARDKGGL